MMVKEVLPAADDADEKAMQVFMKSIQIIGGPRRLVELRRLTWLPSLMEASYAVVYHDRGLTAQEIAERLGASTQTIRNILRADPGKVRHRIQEALEEDDEHGRTHNAGALAKLAWQEIKKEGQ